MIPPTTPETQHLEDFAPSPRTISRVEVAAAMIATTAERPVGHVGVEGYLWDADEQGGCIQGEMLLKLGFHKVAEVESETSGSYEEVMVALGYADENWDGGLARALEAAEFSNDAGLPWHACLEAFERVLGGEHLGDVLRAANDATTGLKVLRQRTFREVASHATQVVDWKITAEVGNCQTGFHVWIDEMVQA